MSNGLKLLLNSARGVFIPRDFVEDFDLTKFKGIDQTDVEVLHDPMHPEYWEAWHNVLQDAVYTDDEGFEWYLWQDGDLWMFCEVRMSDEEYENFFGERRE